MEPTVKLICLARNGYKQARSRPYIFAIALEGRQKAIIHPWFISPRQLVEQRLPLFQSMWCYGLLALWAFGGVLSDAFGVQPRGSIGARRTTGSAKDRSTHRIFLFSFVARKAGSGSGWPVGGEQANGRCRRAP